MSIQLLPQQQTLANTLSNTLGPALQKGITAGTDRRMLQQGLSGLKDLPENATPLQLAQTLINATHGIEGAENYVQTLFPLLLNAQRMQALNGQGQTGLGQGQSTQGQGSSPGQFQGAGGFLTSPKTENEVQEFAQRYALGDPSKYKEGLDIARNMNSGAVQNLEYFRGRLGDIGIKPNEMPYAVQIAQKSDIKDPEKLLTHVKREMEDIRQMDNIVIPGLMNQAMRIATSGWLPGPPMQTRHQAQSKYQPLIDRMIEKGYEPIVREKLAAAGFSPTEIEERIHPVTKQVASNLDSIPLASKDKESNINKIEDFILRNSQNQSLLALRRQLVKSKKYDWKDINQALQRAMSKGLKLSTDQDKELAEFAQPPRDSLMDAWFGSGRIPGLLRGEK